MTRNMLAVAMVVCAAGLAASARAQDGTGTGGSQTTTSDHSTTSGSGGTSSTRTRSTTSADTGPDVTTTTSSTTTADRGPVAAPEREEQDESGRKAVLWLELGGGFSYVDMAALSNNELYPALVELSGTGPAATVAAFVRILFITMGARMSLASYPGFEIGTATVEVGIRPPTPFVQPFLRLGFGYAWHGDANYGNPDLSRTDVYGYVIETGLGIDILATSWFQIGAGLEIDILNMSRQALSGVNPDDAAVVSLMNDGDAVGVQVRAEVHVGVRF